MVYDIVTNPTNSLRWPLRGMVRAMQSVVFILLFMVVVTYVFAIVQGCPRHFREDWDAGW